MYAKIIIDISHEKVDRPFTYRVPDNIEGSIDIGSAVNVPFGSGNKLRKGYVTDLTDEAGYDISKIKDIDSIDDENLQAEYVFVKLAAWMKKQYGSTMINALRTVLPSRKKQKSKVRRYVFLKTDSRDALDLYYKCIEKKQFARQRILKVLTENEGIRIPYELITGKLNCSAQTVRSLAEQGIIGIEAENYYRNPVLPVQKAGKKLILSSEQQKIVDDIINSYDAGSLKTSLINGITGSGKTEVYIRLIEEIVKRGKQAIVLIPEISLTYQTLMRFYTYFGERVSVMNSTLSQGEKYDQAERARNGDIDVIIGPRSALFTPFPNLGLIIIDEEHEAAYKSETMPKYHAREMAVKLAELVPGGAAVVLGSATPSLESYSRALSGEYRLFTLTRRLTGGKLPEAEIVDLRDELHHGNRSAISMKLQEYIADRIEKKEQTMLFINRRGLAGFVSCRECGYVFKCPHCDVALSEHRGGKLVCHYCGYEQPVVRVCPQCGSKYVSAFRAGTQQIESEVHKLFPSVGILRMDADTTSKKGSYEQILSAFADHEGDILIGTQMIVKGHDFPDVTLVGILAADMSLYASDYRAGERTFQLLTQAAGRAGRGTKPGHVIIQTYQPDHYSIIAAAKQDYKAFYDQEMGYRELLMYPPAAHMLAIQIQTYDEQEGIRYAGRLRSYLENGHIEGSVFIGPASASISKINDVYRMVIYIKNRDYEALVRLKNMAEDALRKLNAAGKYTDILMQFDFNPINGF